MAEEKDNVLDIDGAQNYLNDLLENKNEEIEVPENDDKNLTPEEAELLKNAANIEDVDEELDPKQVQKLIDFVGGDWKERNADELNDDDLDRLTKIAVVKAGHFNYRPKKQFGIKYKKTRNRRNKMAKKSRQINRR